MSSISTKTATGCNLVADVAEQFGEVRLKVLGFSMLPAVRPGDTLVVQRIDSSRLQAGQIVLYKQQDGLVAHRIMDLRGNTLITKGDTVPRPDQPILRSAIIGIGTSVIRSGSKIDLHTSFPQRMLAFLARHSVLCLRVLVHCYRMVEKTTSNEEAVWTH